MDDGKVNVMSPSMLAQIHSALDRAEEDGATVVLQGRQGIFSAGFDLAVLQAGGSEALGMLRGGFELSVRLLSFPAPVVMACSGHAIAMGLFLLLSGDYNVGVSGSSRFRANEVAIGLTMPRPAVEVLRQRLVPSCFGRAINLAEGFDTQSAVAAGILDRVVDEAQLHGTAGDIAAAFGALDRNAHAASKLVARRQALCAIRDGIEADFGSPVG
jgi:enoyl-CoA hydratase